MAGYTRQSAASIITTATITAAPLNNEFNALVAAFNATTGHTHSGGTGDGPKLPITSMADIADMKVMGNVSGSLGAVGPVAILDEDDMTSNSATSLVTQQSVKAYADLMLPLAGGTMSGEINAGTNIITGLGTPVGVSDAVTKAYSDLKLPLTGGTMSGDIDAGTNTVTGLGAPSAASDAATKTYVDSAISSLVASAPGALDTLNEIAASLGDDADFAGTMTTSLATKLPLSGGTMTGNIDLNGQFITNLITPTQTHHATSKAYVDGILGSATASSDSADAAAVSAASAASSFDAFDDIYLGAKASDPTLDNDGDALVAGALYFNTTTDLMMVYTGSAWTLAGSAVNGTVERQSYSATASQTTFAVTYDVGFVDVWLNGVKLLSGTDFTASSGSDIVLAVGATALDVVDILAFGSFNVSNTVAPSRVLTAGTGLTGGGDLSVDRTFAVDGTVALVANVAALTGATFSGEVVMADQLLTKPLLKDFGIEVNAHGATGATETLDIENGNYHTATVDEATTLTFSNPTATGDACIFYLELTNGGAFVVTWPAAVAWDVATAPTLQASGVDVLAFVTTDAGTTYRGFIVWAAA
jgi:hypothetical protein